MCKHTVSRLFISANDFKAAATELAISDFTSESVTGADLTEARGAIVSIGMN